MLVAMTKVQIVGRKRHVELVLDRLYRMGLLELVSALEEPALELAPFPGENDRAERGQQQHLLSLNSTAYSRSPATPPRACRPARRRPRTTSATS